MRLYVSAAFIAGVLFTISIDRVRPFLVRRLRLWSQDQFALRANEGKTVETAEDDIREGIEECIGNTPLFKIKSLSRATGCDILAKAEVRTGAAIGSVC